MLPFPQNFDGNEWFLLLTLFFGLSLAFLPRRFPKSLTILIIFFTSFISRTIDHLLASPMWDLYDILDSGKYELFGILSYFFYAPFGYLFLYMYDKSNIKGINTIFYILLWSVFSTGIEWIASLFHVFNYKEWKIYYSFSVYMMVQPLTIVIFNYLKNIYYSTVKQSSFSQINKKDT